MESVEPEADKPAASSLSAEAEQVCVVCFERPGGFALQPCKHDVFCQTCASRFRTCPLCRRPLQLLPVWREEAPQRVQQESHVASQSEMRAFAAVWFLVWLFVFIAGLFEFYHDVPTACSPGCTFYSRNYSRSSCNCQVCSPGYLNGGAQCFEKLEDLPPMKTGGGLGGSTYFGLVLATQVVGCLVEVALLVRLSRRRLLPRKEFAVLISALILEVSRMVLVDAVVLNQYFGDRAFAIFPVPSSGPSCNGIEQTWSGADGRQYCEAPTNRDEDATYYLATRREAFVADDSVCSTFTRTSALLDFTSKQEGVGGSGYNRFSRLGWVLGGQFGLIYFFATFVNEVADIIFVVPTTSNFGWRCKIFSVALEFFQLGALCPAAIFEHTDCLHYTDPMGVSLHAIREVIVVNCYLVWGFILTCIPLALAGAAMTLVLALASKGFCAALGRQRVVDRLFARSAALLMSHQDEFPARVSAFLLMASVPTFASGLFLGVLVVAGQSSKKGFSQILTAVILFSDVAFKVGATALTEAFDYALHLRVRRAVERLESSQPETSQPESSQLESSRLEISQLESSQPRPTVVGRS